LKSALNGVDEVAVVVGEAAGVGGVAASVAGLEVVVLQAATAALVREVEYRVPPVQP